MCTVKEFLDFMTPIYGINIVQILTPTEIYDGSTVDPDLAIYYNHIVYDFQYSSISNRLKIRCKERVVNG